MKKFNKVWSLFCCVLFIITLYNCNDIQTPILAQSSAKSMIVIEASTNRILMSKQEHQQRANASTTKIATFLTVLKHCNNFDEIVQIDDRAIGISGTSLYLKKGESLTVRELLYGMMLVSGNDAATALALHISKSVNDFAQLMTSEAKSCGALNTSFKNPHGLDQEGHFTTAYDLAQITRECYKYEIFKEIVSTKNIKITDSTKTGYRYLKNKNKLLWTMDGAVGVKTGFTNNAGRCLVSSATRNNMQLICVVLNCGPMFEESFLHMENCFEKYNLEKILEPNSFIKSVPVLNSDKQNVKIYTKKDFCYPLTKEEAKLVRTCIDIKDDIKAPLEKDQIVGELKIYLDKHLLFCEKIYTMESVKSNRIEDNVKEIISNW